MFQNNTIWSESPLYPVHEADRLTTRLLNSELTAWLWIQSRIMKHESQISACHGNPTFHNRYEILINGINYSEFLSHSLKIDLERRNFLHHFHMSKENDEVCNFEKIVNELIVFFLIKI